MITLKRYKQNLKVIDNKVYSYDTLVAKIKGNKLYKVKWKAVSKKKLPPVVKDENIFIRRLPVRLSVTMTSGVPCSRSLPRIAMPPSARADSAKLMS